MNGIEYQRKCGFGVRMKRISWIGRELSIEFCKNFDRKPKLSYSGHLYREHWRQNTKTAVQWYAEGHGNSTCARSSSGQK